MYFLSQSPLPPSPVFEKRDESACKKAPPLILFVLSVRFHFHNSFRAKKKKSNREKKSKKKVSLSLGQVRFSFLFLQGLRSVARSLVERRRSRSNNLYLGRKREKGTQAGR